MSTKETGKVKWFNSQKHFGFIARSSGEDIFFHENSITKSGAYGIHENDQVEYEVTVTPKGAAAVDVRIL